MKVITMCVWKRPEVFKKTLHALQQVDGIKDYLLVIHCDGGKGSQPVAKMAKRINFAKVEIIRAEANLGCNESTRRVLTRGFELSDYVIHVEEDIVLAPDALLYFEWAKQFQTHPDVWLISAWRHHTGWLHESKTPFPSGQAIETKALKHGGLWIWGWATWRDRWEVMRRHWTDKDDQTLSWDTCLSRVRHEMGKVAIVPLVSRAQNVGEGGIHRDGCYLDYWAGSAGFVRNTNYVLIES